MRRNHNMGLKSTNKMKRSLITALFLLQGFVALAQQSAQYSQYMFNGIYINPAYAGYKEQLHVHGFYRNQWTGIEGAPESMSLAVDAIANEGNVGLAFQLASDKLGAQSNMSAYVDYAYRLKTNEDGSRLAFGLGLGLVQLGMDGSMLNPNTPEPEQPTDMIRNILPDARAGVFYSTNRWYAGFSVENLISAHAKMQDHQYIPQPKHHYYLTAGVLLPVSQQVQLKPSFLIKDDRGGPTSLDLNTFVLLAERLWVGASYRTAVGLYDKSYLQNDLYKSNSLVFMVELFATPSLHIGYAYDYSLEPLQGLSGGTHEISLGYYFRLKDTRMLNPRYF